MKTVKIAETEILEMISKAALAYASSDALKYSQAACNAANALCSLAALRSSRKG